MEWKKNDRIQVTIEDMGDTGEGIGKTDGYTWFVKDAVIGDEVEAKVMKTKKVLWLRPLRENHQCVAKPCDAAVPGGPPVRRLSAPGNGLQRTVSLQRTENL